MEKSSRGAGFLGDILPRLGLVGLLVLFLNVSFFHESGSVSLALKFIIEFVFFVVILRGFALPKLFPAIGFYFLLLLISSINQIRISNVTISTISILASIATIGLVLYTLGVGHPALRSLWELVWVPFRILGGYVRGIGHLFLYVTGKGEKSNASHLFHRSRLWPWVRSILVGLVLGIPVIVFLIALLRSADPIFSYQVEQVISLDFLKRIPTRIFWSVLLFLQFAPFVFFRLSDRVTSPFVALRKLGWQREATVVMALIVLVMGAFLYVQWPYIFVRVPAETDLSRFGVLTYSEYVKKGFGELLQVAVVLYSIIWAGLLIMRDKERREQGLLPFFQFFALAELLLFVVSIFRRIWLYQLHHGWTLVRMYGGVFLFWLAGMIIFLGLRHVAKKRWVLGELFMTALMIAGLGLFNAEHFIVTTHPPTVNKRVDYVYLSGMSPDGYMGWKMSYNWASDVLIGRGLEQKPILDPLDRRDIVYAGAIMYRLLRQYHRLVLDFGSNDEQMQYVNTLLEYQQPFEGGVELIRTWRRELDEGKRSASETIQAIRFIHMLGYALPFNSNQSLYLLRSVATVRTYDRLDRFFIWNYSAANAYNRMKQDMPYEKLLELHVAYRGLSRKIVSRGELDYPSDISFGAPFLDNPQ